MKKQSELEMIWPNFYHSKDIEILDDYSRTEIKLIIKGFFEIMKRSGYERIATWDDQAIFDTLDSIAGEAERDGSNRANEVFVNTYNVIGTFLGFISKESLIPIVYKELDRVLSEFERQVPMLGGKLPENKLVETFDKQFDQSSLPEWKEYTANEISGYTKAWVSAYMNSPAWKLRTKGVTKTIVSVSMKALSEKAYDIYRKTPKSWTKKAIHGILTTFFVSNVDFTAKQYKYVVPALTELLSFVATKGLINSRRVENYCRYLVASEAEMIELAKNPENFGPAKTAMIDMRKQGIDLKDDEAVQKYMERLNASQGVENSKLNKYEGINLDNVKSLSDDQMEKAIEQYDPSPNMTNYYLTSEHLNTDGENTWSEAEANKLHKLGVYYGIKLWLNRSKYKLPDSLTVDNTIWPVSSTVDAMYSNNLVAPEQWKTWIWDTFADWLKGDQSNDKYGDIAVVLMALIRMLTDDKVLSAEVSKSIIQSLQADIISFEQIRTYRDFKNSIEKDKD